MMSERLSVNLSHWYGIQAANNGRKKRGQTVLIQEKYAKYIQRMSVLPFLLLFNAFPKIQARRHSDQPNPKVVPRVCIKVSNQGIHHQSTTKVGGAESHGLHRATHTY
jgi:hypothetical protein